MNIFQELDGPEVRIADYFDVIAGTSTGGIVAAMLAAPSVAHNGRPVPARSINKFYFEEGPKIFSEEAKPARQQASGWREAEGLFGKVLGWVAVAGVWALTRLKSPEYDGIHLQQKINDFSRDTLLAHTLTNLVVPAYDMQNLRPIIFSSHQVVSCS